MQHGDRERRAAEAHRRRRHGGRRRARSGRRCDRCDARRSTAVCGEWARPPASSSARTAAAGRAAGRAGSASLFDAEHLRRVLVNLLDNARRHASDRPARSRSACGPTPTIGRAVFSVLSDGAPIPADVEPYLFEPFFSTRSRGTGLGLYICRELCERYGARIDYRLAAARRAAPQRILRRHAARRRCSPGEADCPHRMTTASHFSLLVVDDEPDLRTLYELTLLREGYDVETAGTRPGSAAAPEGPHATAPSSPTCACPTARGLDAAALARGAAARREKAHRHHRLRLGRERGRGAEGGRLRLPHQAGRPEAVPRASSPRRSAAAARRADRRRRALPSEHRIRRAAGAPAAASAAAPAPGSAALGRMAGQSMAMQQVRALIEKVARSMAPVLIAGESGTGKELVARADPRESARARERPFVPVNCGAIPENLMESEFFGYSKGAFTGATSDREGFFQAANGGTLFLDEVADLPLADAGRSCCARSRRSACARSARTQEDAGRRAHHQRDAQGPRRRLVRGRRVPPGSVLPAERHRAPRCRRCASGARTCR